MFNEILKINGEKILKSENNALLKVHIEQDISNVELKKGVSVYAYVDDNFQIDENKTLQIYLSINGNLEIVGGELNLAGHKLNISGNLLHRGGNLRINEGSLNIGYD